MRLSVEDSLVSEDGPRCICELAPGERTLCLPLDVDGTWCTRKLPPGEAPLPLLPSVVDEEGL
jgi:hypothetical protein